jgi:F-type H+-transporting ATPase subunit a
MNFFSLLAPIGTPGFLAKSLVAIETISYLGRFISLNVRLFINIISGHLILKLLYSSLVIVLVSINFSPIFFFILFFFVVLSFFIFVLYLFVSFL